eukprot:g13746.t1
MNFLKDVREYLTPVMTESNFEEKGMLTPAEFVIAGDELVSKCGSWRWESGKKDCRKTYLPDNKQYLITRGVPSLVRASTYAMEDSVDTVIETKEGDSIDSEGWLETHTGGMTARKGKPAPAKAAEDVDEITEIGAEAQPAAGPSTDSQQTGQKDGIQITSETYIQGQQTAKQPAAAKAKEQKKPAEDIDDLDEIEEQDEGALVVVPKGGLASKPGMLRATEPEDRIIRTRTYDLSITYDNFHRTPRMWLFGFDEQQQPLSNDGIMEDISADHKFKTVTVDPHPHTGVPHASIHPCRHAQTMKSICDRLSQVGGSSDNSSAAASKKVQTVTRAIPCTTFCWHGCAFT